MSVPPKEFRGPQLFWLRATSSGTCGVSGPLLKQEAGPGPFAGGVGLRTTGVRLLGRQGVVKDNYKTLALTQQEGVPQSRGTDNGPRAHIR